MMDFRRPDNPFPFAQEHLEADRSQVTKGEHGELAHLLGEAVRALVISVRELDRGTRRGDLAKSLSTASGYLDRAGKVLLQAYQQEHPEEDGRERQGKPA